MLWLVGFTRRSGALCSVLNMKAEPDFSVLHQSENKTTDSLMIYSLFHAFSLGF